MFAWVCSLARYMCVMDARVAIGAKGVRANEQNGDARDDADYS